MNPLCCLCENECEHDCGDATTRAGDVICVGCALSNPREIQTWIVGIDAVPLIFMLDGPSYDEIDLTAAALADKLF